MSRERDRSKPGAAPGAKAGAAEASATTLVAMTGDDGSGALLFVDAIENGHARLLLGDEAFVVPTRLLPSGAAEGSWLRMTLRGTEAPPDEATDLRRDLGRDDDGGDIKL